ncbi:hypothetical protein [uncultured Thiothrix sp.]|uniref:hypothetical protein n=1 Tax=uncultured Thiothrix sp. TaxID=223185 RepID=UPI002628043D|nr:hypothetical protein [uncultured Thiothrix sp.]
MSKTQQYKWWQVGAFWFTWSALLLTAYGAALVTYFIGSMLTDYYEPLDIALVVIFALTLFLIMTLIVYTGWHYWQRTQTYAYLMSLMLMALVVIPLLASSGAAYVLTQVPGFSLTF